MINLVHIDEWIAIYKDDKLIYEAHGISPDDLLSILDIEFESKWLFDYDINNFLPKKYSEIE